ncbi:Plakophilin-4 [Saguinus oedipus]|uniref:Plakophilin-4 n=1 Tax=Saguinus oedipus TaxID=9490 RepID=A0ABQ9U7A4_SAGOE|nr:Plakophilin-4 [Saguinus oedipus]
MTAVPLYLGPSLQRTVHDTEQFGQQQCDIYERMVSPRPDSLTGLRSSYASQHSQLGQDLRSAVSPDLHITPIYVGRTYYSLVYRSPNHGTVELQGSQTALYRTGSLPTWSPTGLYNIECKSTITTGFSTQCRLMMAPQDPPSIDSIQKDPREFAWRNPELPEVIHMLQHQFPSVQANAAAYLQHLCFGDNKVKMKTSLVLRNTTGCLRNLSSAGEEPQLCRGRSLEENAVLQGAGGLAVVRDPHMCEHIRLRQQDGGELCVHPEEPVLLTGAGGAPGPVTGTERIG